MRSLLIAVALGLALLPARAHAPHDPILALALSPDFERDGTLFVAVQGFSLLLRSTDRGQSFATVHAGLESGFARQIVISPRFAEDRTLFVTDGRSISISRDGGERWERFYDAASGALGFVHAIHPSPTGGLWISAERGWLDAPTDAPLDVRTEPDGTIGTGPRGQTLRRLVGTPGTPFVAAIDAIGPMGSVGGVFLGHPLLPTGLSATAVCVAGPSPQAAQLYVGTADGRVLVRTLAEGTWRTLGTLAGGAVRDVTVRAGRDGRPVVFAATATGGLFERRGDGEWTQEARGLRPLSDQSKEHFFAVVPSPAFAKDGLVYAATFEGLYVRTGDSAWRHLDVLPRTLMRDVALSPRFDEDTRLWVCGYGDGLLQSDDAGTTFRPLDSGAWLWPDGVGASPDFASDGTILVGTPVRQLLSKDAGASWTLAVSRPGGFGDRVVFSPDYARDGTVFLQLLDFEGTATSTLLVSRDRGGSWQDLSPEQVMGFELAPDYPQSGRAFVATTSGLQVTSDRGATFTSLETPLPALDAVTVARGAQGEVLVVASVAGGLAVLREGEDTWTTSVPPAPVTLLRSAADARGGVHLFGATRTDGLLVSHDLGATWELSPGAQCIMALDAAPDATGGPAVLVGSYDGPWLSRDGARTWTRLVLGVRSPRATDAR